MTWRIMCWDPYRKGSSAWLGDGVWKTTNPAQAQEFASYAEATKVALERSAASKAWREKKAEETSKYVPLLCWMPVAATASLI